MGFVAAMTVLVLLLALLRIASTASFQHQIYVSNNSNTSDKSCWTGGQHNPCAGINLALKGAQYYNFSTVLLIQPGNYSLQDAEETFFHNVTQLAMIGNSSEPGEAVIRCQSPAGLFFANSQDIVIRSLTFSNCGIMFNNGIAAALYFGTCSLVEISRVNCTSSATRAIVFEDTVGNVTVENSEFFLCSGGVAILHTSSSRAAEVRSSYVLKDITFTGNNVTVSYLPFPISFCPRFDAYPSLGMGAGLVVVLKDSTNKNQILVSNCTFTKNNASFGGGLLVALCNDIQGNQVIVSDSNFSENHAVSKNINETTGDGGGALVALEYMVGSANAVLFTRCQFFSNVASHGGGLAIVSYPQTSIYRNTWFDNSIQISECLLSANEAYLGLALYLYSITPVYGDDLSMNMSDVKMSGNLPVSPHITTTGVLYSYDSSFTFLDSITLIENSDTVLVLHHSHVIVAEGAHVSISDNDVSIGKVAVLDCSSITLSENTVLEFSSNRQVLAVVYASCSLQQSNRGCFLKYINDTLHPDNWTAEVSFSGNTGCMMRENDWQCVNDGFNTSNTTLIFDANIMSCAWPENNSENVNFQRSSIFKWQSFRYDGKNYSSMIMSGPTEMCITSDSFHIYEFVDSWLPVSVKNYLGENVNEVVLKVCIMEQYYDFYPNSCVYIFDYIFTVRRIVDSSFHGDKTFDPNVIHLELSTSGINEISRRLEVGFTPCILTEILQDMEPVQDICIYVNDSKMLYGKCPIFFMEHTNADDLCPQHYYNSIDYSKVCAPQVMENCVVNRTGILCSDCLGKVCVSINSLQFTCAEHKPMALLLYLCLQIAPLTLFLFLLVFFGASLNYLSTNSYILFSQMIYISLVVPNNHFTDFNYLFSVLPYCMWSLDFFYLFQIDPFCLFPGMKTIQVIMFQYVTALYPLLVIVVVFAWIEMYARGVKLVFYITRPVAHLLARFSQKIKINRSLPDSFAVLYVLSYTQLVRISIQLLIPTQLTNQSNYTSWTNQKRFYYDGRLLYFSGEHLVCAIVAIVVLIVFVVLPTIFLFLYPFKTFHKMLSLLRLNRPGLEVLYDAFTGSLKNGLTTNGFEMRFFSGIMLLFRVVIIVLQFQQSSCDSLLHNAGFEYIEGCLSFVMAGLILLLQPYKRKASNILDFLMFLYLGLGLFVNYGLISMLTILLPFVCSVCFMLYLVFYRAWSSICTTCCRGMVINEIDEELEEDEEHQPLLLNDDHHLDDGGFADRLLNPEQYADSDEYVAIPEHNPDTNSGGRTPLQQMT